MAAASPLIWSEVELMVEYCRTHKRNRDLMLLLVGCSTGYRHIDYAKITWEELLGVAGLKKVESKTNKRRNAPLSDFVQRQIQLCYESILLTVPPSKREAMKKEPVFKSKANTSKGEVLTRAGVNTVLNSIAKAVGIEHPVTAHSLRKAFAIRTWQLLGENEAAMYYVSSWLNHSSLQMTYRYLGFELKMRTEIVNSMWE